MWRDYLPASFKDRAPREDRGKLLLDGASLFSNVSALAGEIVARQAAERFTDLVDAASGRGQLRAMNRQGVDVAYLFPTYGLYVPYVEGMDFDFAEALASAYNRWLYDYCGADRRRLRGVGLISRHDPATMPKQLEEVLELGWSAVILRPNPVQGRTLGHPAYEPFWSACEANGVAVALHEGTQARVQTVGSDRFRTRFAQHACSHPMEQMLAFLSLLEAGVFARRPRLKVGFLEAGASWLPSFLWRLDELSYPHMKEEVIDQVQQRPSVYFKRQCWISFEHSEPGMELTVATVGAERLLFATDYPHPDHSDDIVEADHEASAQTPSPRVLSENALRFFEDVPAA
jgi:predicted TIM-barrel fold metal-dependent hydrolase